MPVPVKTQEYWFSRWVSFFGDFQWIFLIVIRPSPGRVGGAWNQYFTQWISLVLPPKGKKALTGACTYKTPMPVPPLFPDSSGGSITWTQPAHVHPDRPLQSRRWSPDGRSGRAPDECIRNWSSVRQWRRQLRGVGQYGLQHEVTVTDGVVVARLLFANDVYSSVDALTVIGVSWEP